MASQFAPELGGEPIPVFILGLAALLKNKAATARAKDLDDLRYLSHLTGQPQRPD